MHAVRRLISGLVGFAFWPLRPCSQRRGARFSRSVAVGILAILLSSAFGSSLAWASVPSNAIRYAYNPDGRLSAVINPESETALYNWDAAGNLQSVTRKSSTKLSIIQLEPTQAAIGETINIWGTGFSTTPSNDTVKFNGTAATVTAATAYTLAVKIPTGATSGTVTVQTTTEGPVTSSESFTVGASLAPTITSLSASVAAAGTVITVTGTNFETQTYNDFVKVNQTMAEVTSSTSTSLKFVVPGATGSGRVSIATPQGSATGPDLYIPPPGYTVAAIGPTTNLSLGTASTLTITAAKTVGLATVEASGGEMLSAVLKNITVASGSMRIYTPGNVETGGGFSFESGKEKLVEPVTLPVGGTYTILIAPSGEDVGKVEITPYDADTVTGALTPTAEGSTKTVSLSSPGQRAAYSVSGTAGEEVSLKVSEVTFAKTAWLEWVNPEGKYITEKGFSSNGFMESVVFPTTGTYTLNVKPNGLNTGSLKLTAYNSTAVTGSITPTTGGESKTVTTSVPGQGAKITFSGTAGEEVSLVMSESTIKAGSVTVLTSEGSEVASSYKSFGTSTVLDGPFTLPKTGSYTIRIKLAGEETGGVKLTAYKANEVTGSLSPTTSGVTETVSLPVPGQKAKYSVSGTAGEEVSLKVSEFTFAKTTYLEWSNPEGKRITEKGFSGNGFMESVVFPTTGTYTLLVTPGSSVNTGSLKLTAYNSTAVTGSITPTTGGESKTVTTTVPGQNAKITFSGTAGEEVSLVLSESTIKAGSVAVFTSEGSEVSSSSKSFTTSTTFDGPFALPKTGTYTIRIEPSGEEKGSVKLTAYNSTAVTGSITPTSGGESKTVTTSVPTQRAKITFSATSGQEVSIVLAESTIKGGEVSIDNSGGARISEERSFGSGRETTIGPVKLSSTGTYTILIAPELEYTGSVKLTAYLGSPPHGLVIRRGLEGTTSPTALEGIAPTGGAPGGEAPGLATLVQTPLHAARTFALLLRMDAQPGVSAGQDSQPQWTGWRRIGGSWEYGCAGWGVVERRDCDPPNTNPSVLWPGAVSPAPPVPAGTSPGRQEQLGYSGSRAPSHRRPHGHTNEDAIRRGRRPNDRCSCGEESQ